MKNDNIIEKFYNELLDENSSINFAFHINKFTFENENLVKHAILQVKQLDITKYDINIKNANKFLHLVNKDINIIRVPLGTPNYALVDVPLDIALDIMKFQFEAQKWLFAKYKFNKDLNLSIVDKTNELLLTRREIKTLLYYIKNNNVYDFNDDDLYYMKLPYKLNYIIKKYLDKKLRPQFTFNLSNFVSDDISVVFLVLKMKPEDSAELNEITDLAYVVTNNGNNDDISSNFSEFIRCGDGEIYFKCSPLTALNILVCLFKINHTNTDRDDIYSSSNKIDEIKAIIKRFPCLILYLKKKGFEESE